MSTRSFCTIITENYLPFALALSDSLQEHGCSHLHVLVVDLTKRHANRSGLSFYSVDDISSLDSVKRVRAKFAGDSKDCLRWSLKASFMEFLLLEVCDKVFFLDCDINCFDRYDSLFDEFKNADVLLTPSWAPHNNLHATTRDAYYLHFKYGMINAGFIGASKAGIPYLNWWTDACLFMCEKGFCWDDQGHLQVLLLYNERVKLLRHQGCNLTSASVHDLKREVINGEVMINGRWPIVFIHFIVGTITMMMEGDDSNPWQGTDQLLYPYFKKYYDLLIRNGLTNPMAVLSSLSSAQMFVFRLRELAEKGIGRLLIYGAGTHTAEGLELLGDDHPLEICGIIDDDESKWGSRLGNIAIFGAVDAQRSPVKQILISSSSFEESMFQQAKESMPAKEIIRIYGA